MHYYLGADLGSTKTHTLIVDETGRALGFGESGPANYKSVGYDGMFRSTQDGVERALRAAGLQKEDISGAGFGISGYDWTSEYEANVAVIDRLGLKAPYKFVNDAVPGLVAGAEEGWGVVVVSGTGSNCRGWDREHKREGRVTGHGTLMGEGAGLRVDASLHADDRLLMDQTPSKDHPVRRDHCLCRRKGSRGPAAWIYNL